MLHLEILHEDDFLVVVNKPGGLLVHRSRESSDRVFLLQELREQLGKHLFPIHRLDRAASGAIVFAFSSEIARALQESLGAEDAKKKYLALVRGITNAREIIDRPLSDDNGVSRSALTAFEKIADFRGLSLLCVTISTGRRHQIRRHLAHIKHQIIGDTTYGKGRINRSFREKYALPRLFLHASAIDIRHPHEGRLQVRAPLMADLREFLQRLPEAPADLVETL